MIKRAGSLLLALALCAGLALPARAATATPATDAGAFIVGAAAQSATGGELTTIKKGDVFNIVVMMAVPANDAKDAAVKDQGETETLYGKNKWPEQTLGWYLEHGNKARESYITARSISSDFVHTGTAEVGPYYPDGPNSSPPTWATFVGGEDEPEKYRPTFYRYTLIFRDVIYQGGGNTFSFTVAYPECNLAQSTHEVAIGQCVTTESTGGGDGEGGGNRTPHLMVRSSSYGNELINAGTPFTLAVTLYATKGEESLEDVTVSLNLGEGLSLAGGALSQYIGTMQANSLKEVYFTVLPNISFTGGVATLSVRLQGFGADTGAEASGETAISVPIEQPDRFEITGMELSDTIYVGEGGSITVNFVNKGRNPISNLEAAITGSNLGADLPQQYLGNLAAGTESSVDFDLNPQDAGPVVGTVTLTYEAADGTLKTVVQEFTSTAEAPMMFEDPGMMGGEEFPTEPEPQSGMPLWGWLLIAAGVLGAIVAAVVLLRRRSKKKKAMAALEADDEDF